MSADKHTEMPDWLARLLAALVIGLAASWELSNYGIHVTWHACFVVVVASRFMLRRNQ